MEQQQSERLFYDDETEVIISKGSRSPYRPRKTLAHASKYQKIVGHRGISYYQDITDIFPPIRKNQNEVEDHKSSPTAWKVEENIPNSPILVKNHFSKSLEHQPQQSAFASLALSLEKKYQELGTEDDDTQPNWDRVASCFEIFDEIAKSKTSFQKILLLLRNEIGKAVFRGFKPIPEGGAAYSEQVPYFWLLQQLDSALPGSRPMTGAGTRPSTTSGRHRSNSVMGDQLTDEQAATMEESPPPAWLYSRLEKWLKSQPIDLVGDPEIDKQRQENKLWSVCSKYMGKYKDATQQINILEQQRIADQQRLQAATQEMTQTRAALLDMKGKLQTMHSQLEKAVSEKKQVEIEREQAEQLWQSNFRVLTQKMEGEKARPIEETRLPTFKQEEEEENIDDNMPIHEQSELEKMVLGQPHIEGALRNTEADLTAWTNRITPRPNWNALRPMVAEDLTVKDWSVKRTSEAIEEICESYCKMKIMLAAMQKTEKENQEWDGPQRNEPILDDRFFTGLGAGPDVPKYLRFKGKVRNRKLSKRDAEHLVKEIWKAKCANPKDKTMPMEEFLFSWLVKRFGNIQSVIADWAYNVMDALERYSYDADCDLLLKILKGELVEDIYHEQTQMVEDCISLATYLDRRENGGRLYGKIRKLDFLESIHEYFAKSGKEMRALETALDQHCPGKEVDYMTLFEEDREGNQGEFAEEFREQHLQERKEYLSQLEVAMYNRGDGHGMISWRNAVRGIQSFDMFKPLHEVELYVSRGFGEEGLIRAENDSVSIDVFMTNMKRGQVKKSKQVGKKFQFQLMREKSKSNIGRKNAKC